MMMMMTTTISMVNETQSVVNRCQISEAKKKSSPKYKARSIKSVLIGHRNHFVSLCRTLQTLPLLLYRHFCRCLIHLCAISYRVIRCFSLAVTINLLFPQWFYQLIESFCQIINNNGRAFIPRTTIYCASVSPRCVCVWVSVLTPSPFCVFCVDFCCA